MASQKVALVTGAGTGVGRAVTLALMREGYAVVLTGRRTEMLEAVAKEGAQTPGKALPVQTDVANPESIKAAFARTRQEFGRLDLLFNNAGMGAPAIPIIGRDEVKLLGWTGDETPWQLGAVFVATKTANERHAMLEHALAAFRKGVRDYHDAFTGPGETRADGPTAPAVLAVIAKYTGLSVEQSKLGVVNIDPEARLDRRDVLRQVAWYQLQNLVKGAVDPAALIDARYAVALPEH